MRSALIILAGFCLTTHASAIPPSELARVSIQLPGVERQNDEWSCGINSTTRILLGYGHSVSYEALKAEFGSLSFSVPTKGLVKLDIGLGGKALSERIRKYEPTATSQDFTTFRFVKKLLAEGKPVGTLLYLGLNEYQGLTIPKLHWVVLSGFDDVNQLVSYYDTDDEFRGPSVMNYQTFLAQWQWRGWEIWAGDSSRGFVSQASIYFANGQNGIFWIDRPLPDAVVYRENVAKLLASRPARTTIKSLTFDKQGVDVCSRDHAFELAKDECRRLHDVDSIEKVLVLFPKTENYWVTQQRDSPWGARKCVDHVRDAYCATAFSDLDSEMPVQKKGCAGDHPDGSTWETLKLDPGFPPRASRVHYRCDDGTPTPI
jgi:hypothetical protein